MDNEFLISLIQRNDRFELSTRYFCDIFYFFLIWFRNKFNVTDDIDAYCEIKGVVAFLHIYMHEIEEIDSTNNWRYLKIDIWIDNNSIELMIDWFE